MSRFFFGWDVLLYLITGIGTVDLKEHVQFAVLINSKFKYTSNTGILILTASEIAPSARRSCQRIDFPTFMLVLVSACPQRLKNRGQGHLDEETPLRLEMFALEVALGGSAQFVGGL